MDAAVAALAGLAVLQAFGRRLLRRAPGKNSATISLSYREELICNFLGIGCSCDSYGSFSNYKVDKTLYYVYKTFYQLLGGIMTNDFDQNIVSKIKKMYEKNPNATKLFDWTAELERDATETTLDRIRHKLDISRGEAVDLARELDAVGCAEFIVGRRGQKSRLRWLYSRVSLGKVASGEATALEQTENPVVENDEPEVEQTDGGPSKRLTIAEAKAILAVSLGVPITSIEITIKG
jgi:hypothetical protein